MPNQLSEHKIRMTYSEFSDVYEALKELALASRTDVSQLVRHATSDYIQKRKHGDWKPIPYKTPAEMRAVPMRRLSYSEWRDINEELTSISSNARLDKSDLLRAAVYTYLMSRKK
jgi:hypothetical protein